MPNPYGSGPMQAMPYIYGVHDQGPQIENMPFIRGVHDQGPMIQNMPYMYGDQGQDAPIQTMPNYGRGQYNGRLIDRIMGPSYQPQPFTYDPYAPQASMTPDLRSRLMQQEIGMSGGKKAIQGNARAASGPVQSWRNVPNDPQSLYNMRMAGYENQGSGSMSDAQARSMLMKRLSDRSFEVTPRMQ